MNFDGKKILILGATPETVPLVKAANALGITTYVCDPYTNSAAKEYATNPTNIDCFDIPALCELVNVEGIDGILPGCADILVPIYAKLCELTGKPCYINTAIAQKLSNKTGFKDALTQAGFPTIDEYTSDDVNNSLVEYPIFVKPSDNNSSKGMSIVYDYESFDAAYKNALKFSKSQNVIIEPYLECDDITVGFLIKEGAVGISFTSDRFVYRSKGVGTITASLKYPSTHTQLFLRHFNDNLKELFKQLGYRNGIGNFQGFVKEGKILFYDPATRITGGQNYLLYDIINKASVLDTLIFFSLNGYMPEEIKVENFDPFWNGKHGAVMMYAAKECIYGGIKGLEVLENSAYIINTTITHKHGDAINKIGTANQHCLKIHLLADTEDELKEEIDRISNSIDIIDIDGNSVILPYINPFGQ